MGLFNIEQPHTKYYRKCLDGNTIDAFRLYNPAGSATIDLLPSDESLIVVDSDSDCVFVTDRKSVV